VDEQVRCGQGMGVLLYSDQIPDYLFIVLCRLELVMFKVTERVFNQVEISCFIRSICLDMFGDMLFLLIMFEFNRVVLGK